MYLEISDDTIRDAIGDDVFELCNITPEAALDYAIEGLSTEDVLNNIDMDKLVDYVISETEPSCILDVIIDKVGRDWIQNKLSPVWLWFNDEGLTPDLVEVLKDKPAMQIKVLSQLLKMLFKV